MNQLKIENEIIRKLISTSKYKTLRDSNNVIGYCRSSKKNRYSDINIENQINAIKGFAKIKKLKVTKIFNEGIKRGAKNIRPKFNEMIQFAISNKSISAIIVSSLDRLTREGDKIVDTLLANGINLISIRENSSLINEDGIFATKKGLIEAYLEHLKKSSIISGSRKHVLKRGTKTGIPPFGYIVKKYHKTGMSKIIIDKTNSRKIKRTFELYAQGYNIIDIMKRLNYKSTDIKRRQISNLMRDPFYVGLIVDKALPKPYKGNHTPLISYELFEICMKRNLANMKNNMRKSK
jgi:site-specific DNA recombinase